LFDELIATNMQYGIVTNALLRGGVVPQPSAECREDHLDSRQEQINALTDNLFRNLQANVFVHASITSVAGDVIRSLTTAAPTDHLTDGELARYWACAARRDIDRHIEDYEQYARLHAHVGTCRKCDARLQHLMKEDEPSPRGSAGSIAKRTARRETPRRLRGREKQHS
jgi:hypothetical protein